MKKLFVYQFVVLLSILITSCSKDRNQVRVKNSYSSGINVIVGPADFGTVKSVSTTEYKSVPKGSQTISGGISGKIVIPKHGKHKYTININTVGITTLVEDAN